MAYSNSAPIIIDLDQLKLHLNIQGIRQLSLHFDTPSRRFYLSVIALVVEQMRKSGKIGSVPLEDHAGVLALLNETIGGSAGSSRKEKLLPRIYRKWKDALPDLENASLFKVIGTKKGYHDAPGKTYRFDTKTKDAWANLFEYKGSLQKVRLRFSVEKLGIRPEDVVIVYGNQSDKPEKRTWDRFIENLKESIEDKKVRRIDGNLSVSSPELPDRSEALGRLNTTVSGHDAMKNGQEEKIHSPIDPAVSDPRAAIRDGEPSRRSAQVSPAQGAQVKKRKRFGFMLISGLFILTAAVVLWKFYPHSPFQLETMNSKAPVSLETSPEASIAVLPLANISGDPKEDYLSDGITEQIITALSKTPRMRVIARNSVFTYKGKPVMVQQVSEELGVRYVLEGSVQKSGSTLRIAVQLIDAETGNHLWSERYDRELKDLFAIQDEITMNVIEGLRVKLTEGDQGRIYSRGTDNLQAYLKTLRAGELVLYHRSKYDNALGRQMLEEAIASDPGYVNAYVLLAWTHLHDGTYGWTKTPIRSLERGLEIGQKAVSLDESNASAHSVVGGAYRKLGIHDKALASGERAIALAPNGAEINALHSANLVVAGKNEEALARISKAIHLNPICPMWYFVVQGICYRNTGRYEEALGSYKKALLLQPTYATALYGLAFVYSALGQNEKAIPVLKEVIHLNPNYKNAHVLLAACYNLTGQEEKAHAEAQQVLRIDPNFSADGFAKLFLIGDKTGRKDTIINALHEAGLK